MAKKEVVVKEEQLPADIADMLLEDVGAGQENMTADDFAIPRLAILQTNSPQVEKRGEGYVEGAESGMIIENIQNECFDGEEGIVIVPVSFRRTIIEWGLRSKGGGFVADHGYDPMIIKNAKEEVIDGTKFFLSEDGNSLVDTYEYFVFLVELGGWRPMVISMSSSQMKKARRWNALIDQVRMPNPKGEGKLKAPIYYMSYKLTTIPESNKKGSWFGWDIKKNGKLLDFEHGQEIFLDCRRFYQDVKAGNVKVADPVADTGDTENSDTPM